MDELDRLVDWLWEFIVRWLKIVVTVACLSTILVGSMMFGIGGIVLLTNRTFDIRALEYFLVGPLLMVVAPLLIYRTWSGK